jgi:hypothetical protein
MVARLAEKLDPILQENGSDPPVPMNQSNAEPLTAIE